MRSSHAEILVDGMAIGSEAPNCFDGGDVDGDGLSDLLIGAPESAGGKGAAYLFYGASFAKLAVKDLP